MQPTTLLKLSGYTSVEKLRDDFGSYLLDVAYIAEECEGYVLVAPDDANGVQLSREQDYEWFELVVVEALKQAGERTVTTARHPA